MDQNLTITLSLDEGTLTKMFDFYAEELVRNENPLIYFQTRSKEVTITAYNKAKNGLHKVVFQGHGASYESKIWGEADKKAVQPKLTKPKTIISPSEDQIGSDEVGTGDFFGPIIVVAAYVQKKDLAMLKRLGVTDSKLLSDEKILEIGPKLIQTLDYSQLCLDNAKFNEVTASGFNMNKIKAKMHNRCLLNVHSRHKQANIYQDQFAEPSLYFSYLKEEDEVLRNITFATQGETKFPCVAAASVIARYSFLRHMQKLNESYGVTFPFGASEKVERFAKTFLKEHGEEEMKKVAKISFATMKKISS